MSFVATASVTETPAVPRSPASRPNLVSVGTIVWLSSELMFFAALFAMYFTIRSVDKGQGLPWPGAHLNLTLGSINTTVLLLSSVTCQMGVFAVERGQIKRTASIFAFRKWGLRAWYVLSFLMALYFVLGRGSSPSGWATAPSPRRAAPRRRPPRARCRRRPSPRASNSSR